MTPSTAFRFPLFTLLSTGSPAAVAAFYTGGSVQLELPTRVELLVHGLWQNAELAHSGYAQVRFGRRWDCFPVRAGKARHVGRYTGVVNALTSKIDVRARYDLRCLTRDEVLAYGGVDMHNPVRHAALCSLQEAYAVAKDADTGNGKAQATFTRAYAAWATKVAALMVAREVAGAPEPAATNAVEAVLDAMRMGRI